MKTTDFDKDQFADAYPPGIERSWWQIARNRIIARQLARHVPVQAKLLEVGCGTGIVTCFLRRKGWNVTGVELGTPQNGVQCRESLLLGQDAAQLPEELRMAMETLLFFDVIEHIEDVPGFLGAMLTAFPKATKLVVTVPAHKELWTTFDDHFGHFRRYGLAMLDRELAASGLRTVQSGYFFHLLYPAIALNNLLRGNKRNIVFNAPAPGVPAMLNRAMGHLFNMEARLVPRFFPGSSIIAVAERATQQPA